MNKYGIVFGAAAVAVIAGCKDPEYKYTSNPSQTEVKQAGTDSRPASFAPVVVESAPEKHCTCAPGTVHERPCVCGAANCACAVAAKPVVTADLSTPVVAQAPASAAAPVAGAPEAETTVYVVQRGDYLSKISKKFNITIAAIKKLNPSIKADNVVRIGQKLKLPGKVDVGVQAEPAKPAAKAAAKAYAPYTGATKEYVVKSGDTLGGIAYSNGINIRQLKELNGLQKDTLRVGQKLKIPADKVAAAKSAPAAAPKKSAPAKSAAAPAAKVEAPAATEPAGKDKPLDAAALADEVATGTIPAAPAAEAPAAETSASAAPAATYVVQEGDDMTGVSIRWGVSAAEIRELNNLGEKDQLVPGQIIKLPADAQQ